jgi:hypothetical protein
MGGAQGEHGGESEQGLLHVDSFKVGEIEWDNELEGTKF